jgi:hypothetical protein
MCKKSEKQGQKLGKHFSKIIMDMGTYLMGLFQESFQKNPPEVTPWRNFVQKVRNNRNTFSEIIMDMGKNFSCKWGKNRLFQESFQKNLPDITAILYMESNSHYVKKLCEEK